jgi:hypothetical protein
VTAVLTFPVKTSTPSLRILYTGDAQAKVFVDGQYQTTLANQDTCLQYGYGHAHFSPNGTFKFADFGTCAF